MALISIVFYNTTGSILYIRIIRRTDQKILDTTSDDFETSPTWADTVISVIEQTAVSNGLYSADVTFPVGSHICDIVILDDDGENSTPIEGFEFIADGTNGNEGTVKLSLDALDNVSVTEPSGRAATFREMMIQLYMRFFNKVDKTSSQIRTYDESGVEVTSQSYTSSGGTDTVSKA